MPNLVERWVPLLAVLVALAPVIITLTAGEKLRRQERVFREAATATADVAQRKILQSLHQQIVAQIVVRQLTPRRRYDMPLVGGVNVVLLCSLSGYLIFMASISNDSWQQVNGGDADSATFSRRFALYNGLGLAFAGICLAIVVGYTIVQLIHGRGQRHQAALDYVAGVTPIDAPKEEGWRKTCKNMTRKDIIAAFGLPFGAGGVCFGASYLILGPLSPYTTSNYSVGAFIVVTTTISEVIVIICGLWLFMSRKSLHLPGMHPSLPEHTDWSPLSPWTPGTQD